MSENRTAANPPQKTLNQLQTWKAELVQIMLRLSVFLGMVLMGMSAYFYLTIPAIYLLPFVVVLYAAIPIATYVRWSYEVKAWVMTLVPAGIGILALFVAGWTGDVRLSFMLSVVLCVIYFDAPTSFRLLTVLEAGVILYIILYFNDILLPIVPEANKLTLVQLITTLINFNVYCITLISAIYYLFPRMVDALTHTQTLSEELEAEQQNLSQRAHELERSYEDLQHRSEFLEATVEVTRVFSNAVELGMLLERAVAVMSRAFGYYHIGIFIVEEEAQWAELRAASSHGGRRLIAGGHRLRSGNHSMVGWVLANHQDRISNAVSDDPFYYANPNLPETVSALTMPLMNADQVIGILDIQSRVPDVFQEADVQLIRGVADQLALAIRNALRLSDEAVTMEVASPFYRVARNLATARTDDETLTMILQQLLEYNASQGAVYVAYDESEVAELAAVLRADTITITNHDEAFQRDVMAPIAAMGMTLENPMWLTDVTSLHGKMSVAAADMLTSLALEKNAASMLIAPIHIEARLSGMVIAFYDALHTFSPFERQLIRLLTDLSGVAMERSRLLVDARTRLERERLLGDVAARMRTTLDMDLVLQGALQEIGDRLNIPDIEVRMGAAHEVNKSRPDDPD